MLKRGGKTNKVEEREAEMVWKIRERKQTTWVREEDDGRVHGELNLFTPMPSSFLMQELTSTCHSFLRCSA